MAYFYTKMDQYSFDRKLQEGAFGEVWAGTRLSDNLPVSNENEKNLAQDIYSLLFVVKTFVTSHHSNLFFFSTPCC